jgi:ubiquinone/menaquinone biosynthesis C-methylase UbiE
MRTDDVVARHYGGEGLLAAIEAGLAALGVETPTVDDLAPVDELHMGGRRATEAITGRLALGPDAHLLDIGSGIGGPARFLASRLGCRVAGIDLTPRFVETARHLTARVGLAERVTFHQGSALDLPFDDAAFDAATLIHVGMNIEDKARLFEEAFRVLRPGGTLVVYEVMRQGGDPDYPTPWAATAETSFLAGPEAYRAALLAAGFEVGAEEDRTDLALEVFRAMRARIAESGPPPLGLHLTMGEQAPLKIANLVAALEQALIAPIEMPCRR